MRKITTFPELTYIQPCVPSQNIFHISAPFQAGQTATHDKYFVQPEQKQVFAWMPAQHEHFVKAD
jgi:hypothetical protein